MRPSSLSGLNGNALLIGQFLTTAKHRTLPSNVTEAAKRCLVDWTGVAIAGAREPVAQATARYGGFDNGPPPLFGKADPQTAALVWGAAGHALDFDDTHIPTDSHLSATAWPTIIALASDVADGTLLLRAFASGYEVAAKLSGRRLGFSLQFRMFHPTSVIGRMAAASAAAVLLELNAEQCAHALAMSLTQASGLRSSMGGMGKPLQVGRVAMDGVICAQLARAGAESTLSLMNPQGGFDLAFVQDGSAQLARLHESSLGIDWAVLRTSYKPYACLHGIHPSIDAARHVAAQMASVGVTALDIKKIRIYVAPGVKKVAQFTQPETPLQAKFSVVYCVALGLCGRAVGVDDFLPDVLADPLMSKLGTLSEVCPEEGRKMLDSAVTIELVNGEQLRGETRMSKGHPGNPMNREEIDNKFLDLTMPTLGPNASSTLNGLWSIDAPDGVKRLQNLFRNCI